MRLLPRGPQRPRAAFTLIELIVVMGIIAVLVGLTATAVFRVLATQKAAAADTTLEKVDKELEKQWKVVLQTADKEVIPNPVIALANGDEHRARVIWIKLRLKQEFPTTYAEAHNPAPGFLNGKSAFRNLPLAAKDRTTESSACLLIALTQARGGTPWDPESTLGAGFLKDSDGDGVREIMDSPGGTGKAIYFVRLPIPNANLNLPAVPQAWVQDLNPAGMVAGSNDTQDPDGTLLNQQWTGPLGIPSANAILFGKLCHPVQPNRSWQNLTPFVASAGSNKVIGDNDDRYSYRLKSAGSGGQR